MASSLVLRTDVTALTLAPATPGQVVVTVINGDSTPVTVSLAVSGLPAGWASVDPSSLSLAPGEAGQMVVVVEPPADAPPGQYPYGLQAIATPGSAEATSALLLRVEGGADAGREPGVPLAAAAPFALAPPPGSDPLASADTATADDAGMAAPPPRRRRRLLLVALLALLALLLCLATTATARPMLQARFSATPAPDDAFACALPTAIIVTPVPLVVAVTPGPPAPAIPTPAAPVMSGGFLDLPFPYSGGSEAGGDAAQFLRAVNRAAGGGYARGGRVNSFFDHQYPLEPWTWQGINFGGDEPPGAPAGDNVLLYDGSRDYDVWYSGHAGYDFAPNPGMPTTTPVFAAADGIIHRVYIGWRNNHIVEIRHPVPGVGVYLTQYLHLDADNVWEATRARVGQPIRRGERIGTMGNTGPSTGVHLHLETRFDANGDGVFDANEVVDPFGFAADVDPWGQSSRIVNARGQTLTYSGIPSRYLWRHPLGVTATFPTGQERLDLSQISGGGGGGGPEMMAACPAANSLPAGATVIATWSPDPPPTDTECGMGYTYTIGARDAQGQTLSAFGSPMLVSIAYDARDMASVTDPARLAIYLYRDDSRRWEALPTTVDTTRRIASARLPRPGKYMLMAPVEQCGAPPRTFITLAGQAVRDGVYNGDVTVRMSTRGGPADAAAAISYTLDLGATWQAYRDDQPPVVRVGTPPLAADAQPRDPLERGELDVSGMYVVMGRSARGDSLEVRPAVVGFSIESLSPTVTATRTATPVKTATATSRPTATDTPPSATDTPPPEPTDVPTLIPTLVPIATRTPTPIPATATPTATAAVAPVADFTADDAQVVGRQAQNGPCECTTLRWHTENVSELYLDGQGVTGPDGERQACPIKDQTYTLRAMTANGPLDRQVTVKVISPFINFYADKTTIGLGESTTLHWETHNIRQVFLDGQGVAGIDKRSVKPTRNQTYTLRVVTACEVHEPQIEVVVIPPTPIVIPPTLVPTAAPLPNLTAPGSLACSLVTDRVYNFVLKWADTTTTETEFRVERSSDKRTWGQIGVVGANTTGYTDGNQDWNVTRYYRVRAYRQVDGQFSPYSDIAQCSTPGPR